MSENGSNSNTANNSPVAKVHPSKNTYSSIAADVTVDSALAELIDNSIDSAAIHDKDPVNVTIRYDEDAEEMVYSDHAGGVKADEMGVFLGLGRSKDRRAEGRNIGAFGMGTKKALNHLASSFTIASRHEDADQGWQYTVVEEFFAEDNETWEFEMEPAELDPGQTVLTLHDLSFDWDDVEEDVRDQLEQKYQRFLTDDHETTATLNVDLTGEELTPPPQVQWSFSPWQGGAHPRRFTGLEFTDDQWSAPIQVEVTVGLMRRSNIENVEPGTAFFCQDRLVEQGLTGAKGGFGQFGMNKFNNAKDKRLRIEIDFYTEGDADNLPWNSDKSRISRMHAVLSDDHGVYYWLRRFADRHKRVGQYGRAPPWIFTEYGPESLHAANDGEIEVVSVADKQHRLNIGEITQPRIHSKPSKDLSLTEDLKRVALAHSALGIHSEQIEWFESWVVPAYERGIYERFTDQFETDDEHLAYLLDIDELEEILDDDGFDKDEIIAGLYEAGDAPDGQTQPWDSEENITGVLGELSREARLDVQSSQRRSADAYDDVRVHRYEYELARACTELDVEIDDLEPIDDGPAPFMAEDDSDDTGETTHDGVEAEGQDQLTDDTTTGEDDEDQPGGQASTTDDAGDSVRASESANAATSAESIGAPSQTATTGGSSDDQTGTEASGSFGSADQSRDSEEPGAQTPTRDPNAVAAAEQLEQLQREHDELLNRLGIDESADPDELIDQLLDAAEQLQRVLDLLDESPAEGESLEERLQTVIDQANRYERMMQAAGE